MSRRRHRAREISCGVGASSCDCTPLVARYCLECFCAIAFMHILYVCVLFLVIGRVRKREREGLGLERVRVQKWERKMQLHMSGAKCFDACACCYLCTLCLRR